MVTGRPGQQPDWKKDDPVCQLVIWSLVDQEIEWKYIKILMKWEEKFKKLLRKYYENLKNNV